PFLIGDDAPSVTVTFPTGGLTLAGVTTVAFTLADSTSDTADVELRFSSPSLGKINQPMTIVVGTGTALATGALGVAHSVAWNTVADIGANIVSDVTISATPSDRATGTVVRGTTFTVPAFTVRNNAAPVAFVT